MSGTAARGETRDGQVVDLRRAVTAGSRARDLAAVSALRGGSRRRARRFTARRGDPRRDHNQGCGPAGPAAPSRRLAVAEQALLLELKRLETLKEIAGKVGAIKLVMGAEGVQRLLGDGKPA